MKAQVVSCGGMSWSFTVEGRAGKTTAAFNHLLRDAINRPGTRYAYIAPTYRQAKRIVWGMVKEYSRNVPGIKYNESDLTITLKNGSEILILGAQSADDLRGIALWGCFLDEYPLISPVIFTEIITKCLADHQGYCIFGGTPKGKGHFFKAYKVALANPQEWGLAYKTIDDSLRDETGEVIENLRKSLEDDKKLVAQGLMTEDEYQQEWYNSFEAAIKGAVYLKELAFMREKGRISTVPWDPKLPVFTVWDLGIGKSDAMAIGFFQKVGQEPRMIDYYENTNLGLSHYIKVVASKTYVYGKHFAPHDINHKELTTGKTRLETARGLGIDFEVIPRLNVDDGIDLARALLHRLWIDSTNCETFLDFVGQYKYDFDIKRGINRRSPVHDFTSHAADVLRYAATIEDEMQIDDFEEPPEQELPDDEYEGDIEPDDDGNIPIEKKRPKILKGIKIGQMGHGAAQRG